MKRLALIFVASLAMAQPIGCGWELNIRWNRFVKDANRYVAGLDNGVVDVKTRARLDKEWQAVTRCECW